MGRPSHPATRIAATFITGIALVVGGIAASSPAIADSSPTNPADPKTPATVTADPLDAPQIDGVVWDQAISGTTDFVGGQFTTARPAGSPAGVNTVPRPNILSFDIATGLLNAAFAPNLNAQVKAVVVSPDGKYVFAGGSFTTVNGVSRNRIVKLDATTGAVVAAFSAGANSTVNALAISGNTLYVGGAFSNVTPTGGKATSRTQLAAVDATTGALLSWAPSALGGGVSSLLVSPDDSKVVIGGGFTTLNGSSNPGYGLAAVDSVSGSLLPWAINSVIRNGGADASITSLTGDSTGVYGTGYVFGSGGTIEGTFHSDWDGNVVWIADCHGDTYSTAVSSTAVYSAGHSHYCATLGGFEQTNPVWTFHRAVAFSKTATTTLKPQIWGSKYTSYAGQPGPSLLNWNPELVPGTFTGKTQAAWSVVATDDYVVYGGEFPSVNGKAQEGLVRFAVHSIAPDKQGPINTGSNFTPSMVSNIPGRVKLSWVANSDRDNATLIYRIYRDGDSTPIYETTQDSSTWYTPQMGFTDTGVAPGSTHSYKLTATDPDGNVASGNLMSITVAGSPATGYLGQVLADGASNFWRLDESAGTSVTDVAGYNDMVAGSTVTRNVAGATADGDTASSFTGVQATNLTSTSFAATQGPIAAPATFTEEAWFKTSSSTGGKIIGFGDQAGGFSKSYDRHLYFGTNGKLNFGIAANGVKKVLTSPTTLNDGTWHQAVGSYGGGVMKLYVDGKLLSTLTGVAAAQSIPQGYWRIGGDASWAGAMFFNGSIDDVSIYPTALTDAQVATQFTVGKTNTGGTVPAPPANVAPTAAFTQSASDLTASFDGTSSTDSDGTIASYVWDFGDGSTATGATATHTYASANTYAVKLTVIDNGGATASTTQNVTVTAPVVVPVSGTIATDTFNRTTSNGWGTADFGGDWTRVGTASNLGVRPGSGSILLTGPSAQAGNYLASTSQTSVDLSTQVSLNVTASGGGTQVSVQGRKVGSADYRATLLLRNDGTAKISLVGNGATIANPVLIPGTISAGTKIDVRLQVTGTSPTTIRAKAWVDGTTEPATWTVSATDSTAALQTPGSLGILGYESGSSTGAQTISVFSWNAVAP